ncbi:MAG: hypothetical protein ABL878_17095 [Burkholderiales bacterium]
MSVSVLEYTLRGDREKEHLAVDAMSDAEYAKHLAYSEMLHLAITLYVQQESWAAHRLFTQQRERARGLKKSQTARHEEGQSDSSLGDFSQNGPANAGAYSRIIGGQECFSRNEQK